jgi:hypothetical protein
MHIPGFDHRFVAFSLKRYYFFFCDVLQRWKNVGKSVGEKSGDRIDAGEAISTCAFYWLL